MDVRVTWVAEANEVLLGVDSAVLELNDVMPGLCRCTAAEAFPESLEFMNLALDLVEFFSSGRNRSMFSVSDDHVSHPLQFLHFVLLAPVVSVVLLPSELTPEQE